MIDSRDYSENKITYYIKIGGLEIDAIQQTVIKTIEKMFKPFLPLRYHYFFKEIGGNTVLVIDSPVQFIPDLVKNLCKKRLAIYEIRELDTDEKCNKTSHTF